MVSAMMVAQSGLLSMCSSAAPDRPRLERSFLRCRRHLSRTGRVLAVASEDNEWREKLQETEAHVQAQKQRVQDEVLKRMASLLSAKPSAGGASAGDGKVEQLRIRILAAQEALATGLVERDAEVRLLLLAAFSGEHLLLLGPPGTAKSELGRRLSKLCKGTFFERLLTRFSVPEELFGPLSLQALEKDQYIRQTNGYLPEASVAFVDEVFKANSAVLNSLLTILNERLFDNGSQRVPVPLICLVGASNELPESEELDALYDRFLFRFNVSPVSEAGLIDLLQLASHAPTASTATSTSPRLELDAEEMAEVREQAYKSVALPMSMVDTIGQLRSYLQQECEPPVYVSDRRLVKAVAMLRVAAYTCGRSAIDEMDMLLLEHVLWQRPEEAERIRDWLLERMAADRAGLSQMEYIMKGLFARACRLSNKSDECEALAAEAGRLRAVLAEQLVVTGDATSGLRSHLWISPTNATRASQSMRPLLTKRREAHEQLLREVVTLETALEMRMEVHVLALLLDRQWGDFIRNGAMEEVRPHGTTTGAGRP